jgi:hypothetical protein
MGLLNNGIRREVHQNVILAVDPASAGRIVRSVRNGGKPLVAAMAA